MNKKFCSFLGLARKSGNLIIGFDNIEKRKSKAKLLVSACDASARTEKNIELLSIPLIRTDLKKTELGKLLGCSEVSVAAVSDNNFAEQLKIHS